MDKILTFKIGIDGLENKIWREIEIPDRRTVADLAYTILASFNSLAYHLYNITYKNSVYSCWECNEDNPYFVPKLNAVITKLRDLKLDEGDTLKMEYDTGSTTTFNITYLNSRELKSYKEQELYPIVVNGEGLGMLDDMSDLELKEIIDDTDKLGVSEHYFTPGYEINEKYDYRKYDIKQDNIVLKGRILAIKNGYEVRK